MSFDLFDRRSGGHGLDGGCVRKGGRKALAVLAALATLAAGGLTAQTALADGGGGNRPGTGGGGGAAAQFWQYKDDETGSWGPATDVQSVAKAMAAAGVSIIDSDGQYNGWEKAQGALDDARAECEANFAKNHPGEADAQCRVVAVGAVAGAGGTATDVWNGSGIYDVQTWRDNWNKYVAPNTYHYAGTFEYKTSYPFEEDASKSVDSIMEDNISSTASIVVIVLDKYQPAQPNYDLSISTQASGTTTKAGDTGEVSDTITLSNNGSSIVENVSGTSTLHWRGVDGTTKSVTKTWTSANNSSTQTKFSYRDLDASWTSWPSGDYYFDTHADKQGKMAAAVDHWGQNDPAEKWNAPTIPTPVKTLTNAAGDQVTDANNQIASGSLYTAHIKAHSSGSQHFWLYDIIDVSSQQVVIGGTDADDVSQVSVTDETGATVAADISVDDSQSGKRIVKAYVKNAASRWYTLNVPQSAKPTGSDYTIPDDSKACYTGDDQTCQTGDSREVGKVTPSPDKVWVLDADGALHAEDPNHTNDQGSDNRTFVTGDAIGSVVNGEIPAHLLNPLTSYSITDDWSASADWIDWDHQDQVRVYVDGKDRTDQFDITVDTKAHTTTAKAKATFLLGTALKTSASKVKLYLGGYVKSAPNADYAADEKQLTNAGSETWNNETTPTNEPPVFVRNPKPDKAWSVDQGVAGQVSDPDWSNSVSADGKTFVQQDTFAVTVNGTLPKNLAKNMSSYELGDDFSSSVKYIDLDQASVKVTIDGQDSTSLFDVHRDNSRVWVTAKADLLADTYNKAADREVRLTISGAFRADVVEPGQTVTVPNSGWEKWNDQTVPSNTPEVKEWSPNPDKSWIRYSGGQWHAVIDPDETNKTGADTLKFLDGDQVGSVVNGVLAANLAKVEKIELADDYADADYIFDATGDVSRIRVYEATASTDTGSSVADIINTGTDVTDRFTIRVDGTRITATANADYMAEQVELAQPKQITLFVPGVVNFADGAGASQVLEDHGKQAGDELTFCDDADGVKLTNSGSQTVNNETVGTNEPHICGYIPPVKKKVVAEKSQGGKQEDIDGKVVYPGERVEYQLDLQPKLPSDLSTEVESVSFHDQMSEYGTPSKQTLEMWDLNTGDVIDADRYQIEWDDEAHSFTLTVTDQELIGQWRKAGNPRLRLKFEFVVSEDAPADKTIDNRWELTVNNSVTPSNKVTNLPPDFDPSKDDTQSDEQGDPSVSIDGKTMLLTNAGNYVVTLDLTQKDTAYKVWKAGIVDDYDQEYVTVNEQDIEVLSASGEDVTDKFNVAIIDGVAYVFARTVDTPIPATGETVPGDPQPTDLKAYAESDSYDPLADPSIDQTLLGQTYQVVLPFVVSKVDDGYTVVNEATQVLNDQRKTTNQVSNPLRPINPSKDVVVSVDGDSVDGHSIWLDRLFLYRLDSSVLPVDRAYPEVTDWSITDPFDVEHDEYQGAWAAYLARDLYKDGEVIAKAGEKVAGTGFDSTKFGGDLFEAVWDEETGTFTVSATDLYKSLVSADTEHEAAWYAFPLMRRIALGTDIENDFVETINGVERPSNVVRTNTPDTAPSIHIEKFDEESGWPDGDRDDTKDALELGSKDEEKTIVFRITNTSAVDPDTGDGAWYLAKDLDLTDETVAGDGEVVDLEYPDDWSTRVLKPGDSVDVKGTLKGVTDKHTDRAQVTGVPLFECPATTDPLDPDSDDATSDADAAETVEIEGRLMCADTSVTSNTDDWSAKVKPPLADTGLAIGGVVVAAILIAGAGLGLLAVRRRDTGSQARHSA
ncbi:LPXTG cell wall anchor domain-containing protein [Bifidobacterium eulemuris]|uniref:LPXTG cell wall anchor domain-containing protein n=1 Tax=Bifidobacterium eulemuris TaxID=1765219 RepID=A0A261GDY9_9BIFI|nr:LPXTG cell wall anchor domain-containing protein [Bifidobacterium eulemuris]OZG69627.1 peptidase [Bifidobacterium eulemuris]QOL32258.1 LPXTG cell wall anchor domain-containing protein [Bifidobacterium eulemuris]